ncbi:site-specific DNA-methyltransferase (adenine-specific) [Dyadobacter koreensis]|uniref:Methyltransferase n=1 Tax=Dyadobacter koreensis TaxID=408657 RepID=A0A1H6QZJ8_9BACT|nr:DNA methyltransferase [Dyadobacter koreensis]SEI46424.1 site-specific DNA-methyltransferase (adenine-specific) [Dyadobacter koreensis]
MAIQLFETLRITNRSQALSFAEQTGISFHLLKYYNDNNILPSISEIESIAKISGISKSVLMLSMGIISTELMEELAINAIKIGDLLKVDNKPGLQEKTELKPQLVTSYGSLFQADCNTVLQSMPDNSVDLIFADPPFNLNKQYPSNMNDNLIEKEYLAWSEKWIDECIRVLKPGGSFFLWNIPKWNTYLSDYLNQRLTFRHWITADIKYSLPIQGRLYPSHYSLLYYCKGKKPNYFNSDRLPMEICPKCKGDLKDYGGYKDKMNPKGISMTDVWYDIPPVRHTKYKKRKGANELSIKLIDRILEMASQPGDVVFDPFGGSGSTYVVAELKERKWIGVEIGPVDDILARFQEIESERPLLSKYRNGYNRLFTAESAIDRKKRGLWTDESFNTLKPLLLDF